MAWLEKDHEGWREIRAFRFLLIFLIATIAHPPHQNSPDITDRRAGWFGSWLPTAVQGKGSWGQAERPAVLSRARGQGVAAGEMLLHKENPRELEK